MLLSCSKSIFVPRQEEQLELPEGDGRPHTEPGIIDGQAEGVTFGVWHRKGAKNDLVREPAFDLRVSLARKRRSTLGE